MKKFDRVVSTLLLLQSKRLVKGQVIADHFQVSTRTIYRDISTLKQAGVPIIGDPGIGYSIVDGYNIPPLMFSEKEATALFTAEKLIGSLTDSETEKHYSSALLKIKAILRSNEKRSLAVLDDAISVSDHNHLASPPHLQEIFNCIANTKVIRVSYKKPDGSESERDLEPIGCYRRANSWYLVAYCQLKSDYRTFKISRIEELRSLDVIFDQEHMGLQEYIALQRDKIDGEQLHLIQVSFHKEFFEFAERRKFYFGYISEEVVKGEVHMKFLNASIEIMARWLLQFGNKARVLAPEKLVDRMRELSKELVNHH